MTSRGFRPSRYQKRECFPRPFSCPSPPSFRLVTWIARKISSFSTSSLRVLEFSNFNCPRSARIGPWRILSPETRGGEGARKSTSENSPQNSKLKNPSFECCIVYGVCYASKSCRQECMRILYLERVRSAGYSGLGRQVLGDRQNRQFTSNLTKINAWNRIQS